MILTEGGFDRKGKFRHKKFFPARSMRKTWQYQVLTRLKSALPNTPEMSRFINMLFKKYNEGFYVYLPKESRVNNPGKIARYVARYVRHPAIANFRLYYYDGDKVVFWYQDHDDNKFYVDMLVEDFIYSLIRLAGLRSSVGGEQPLAGGDTPHDKRKFWTCHIFIFEIFK